MSNFRVDPLFPNSIFEDDAWIGSGKNPEQAQRIVELLNSQQEAKRYLDDIAQALHPYKPADGWTYLPQQLAEMVRGLLEQGELDKQRLTEIAADREYLRQANIANEWEDRYNIQREEIRGLLRERDALQRELEAIALVCSEHSQLKFPSDYRPRAGDWVAGILALLELLRKERDALVTYLLRQVSWSGRTFGYGRRTLGVTGHIAKELDEIRANPHDLSEWIDVIILAMDGYWRHGGDPRELMKHLQAKQDKNFARQWPAPTNDDIPVEHVRDAAISQAPQTNQEVSKASAGSKGNEYVPPFPGFEPAKETR